MSNQPPTSPWRTPFRGMQIHAVPDADKAYDSTGRRLPWAYDLDPSASTAEAASDHLTREPIEKGPFGRSQRRSRSTLSRSRSKTAEPRREEERARAEQIASEDAVFGGLRRREGEGTGRQALAEVDGNALAGAQQASSQQQATGAGAGKGEVEAIEVMLYGFGEELQWAALDHYERVSGGVVLEDYDRQPPNARFDVARSLSRATSQRSFTRAALKKKNTFAGGAHWIKVTFDSRVAAELACARSPHIIKGHLVYAEPYLGRGPGKDEAILASQAGAQIMDEVLPASCSTNNMYAGQSSPNGSSTTATSATATNPRHQQQQPQQRGGLPYSFSTPVLRSTSPSSSTTLPPTMNANTVQPQGQNTVPRTPATLRHRRISGATPATVLPVTAALMPKPPKKSWSAWLGAGEVIGSTVPKKEDGTFDHQQAGLWWTVWWWVDWWLGTDWVGLKGE